MGIIQRQGLKNTVVTFAGILLGFVSLLYIQPKFLTAEEIGLTRVLFSFSSLAGVFLPLGIGTITVKYFPLFRSYDHRHNGFFGLILLFMTVGFFTMGGLLHLTKPYFVTQFQQQSKLFIDYYNYVLPFSFIIGFNAVLTLYCNSLFKTTIPTLFNEILVRVLSIVLFTVYFCKLISLQAFIILFVGVYGTQTISLLAYIYITDNPGLQVNWELLRKSNYSEMLIFGLWMSFVSVASLGIKFIDSIVLAKNFHLEFVGIYAIAAFIPNVIEAPLNSLDKIAGTKIAHAITHKDYDEVRKIYYLSSKYLFLIGGLIFVGIVTNIEFVLQLLPPKFMGGLEVVYIISLGALFSVAGGANNQIIFSSDNFWKGGILLMGIALTALLLNVILIPLFGINGAAMATALSALLYNTSKVIIVYRNFNMQPFGRQTFWVIAIMVMCLVVNNFIPVFPNIYTNIAIRTFLITTLYLSAAFAANLTNELVDFFKSSARQIL